MQTDLKLPYAGQRSVYYGTFQSQGGDGQYWSSSPNSSNWEAMALYDSGIQNPNANWRGWWASIRCFKN